MKDFVKYKDKHPENIEGRVCIDYFDPVTHRVKDRIEGKNHIFADNFYAVQNWLDNLSSVPLFLSTSNAEIDSDFPFLRGNIIGWGVPGSSSSGAYRGNWDTVNSYRLLPTATGVKSKFVYEFLSSQALGVLGSIGLTFQYADLPRVKAFKACYTAAIVSSWHDMVSFIYEDTLYYISAGIVHRKSIITGTDSTVNLTAIIGTSGYQSIGVNPSTGMFYLKLINGSTRNVYEFSDKTFSSLLSTYSISSWSYTSSGNTNCFFVYGNYLYMYNSPSSSGTSVPVYKIDFVNNSGYGTFSLTKDTVLTQYTGGSNGYYYATNLTAIGKYVIPGGGYAYNEAITMPIFDLESGGKFGDLCTTNWPGYEWWCKHPFDSTDKALYMLIGNSASTSIYASGAIAAYKLPDGSPSRPDGYGMTVSYEIEVQY